MSNPLSFLPSLGMGGFWALSAPYNQLVSPSAQYRSEGVQSLSAAIADGKDPLNSVYLANGDTKENFERDLREGISLVTISSDSGLLKVFPANAILMVPSGDGVVYRNTLLSIALSALPEGMDLSVLENEIIELVMSKIGVRAATYVTTVGAATILSKENHDRLMATREDLITSPHSLIARNSQLTSQVAEMGTQIATLSDYIKTNLPLP